MHTTQCMHVRCICDPGLNIHVFYTSSCIVMENSFYIVYITQQNPSKSSQTFLDRFG